MSKKDFKKGINALLGGSEKKPKPIEKPIPEPKEVEAPVATATIERPKNPEKTEARTTFILDTELLERLKALAYWERLPAKAIVKDALEQYLSSKGETYVEKAVKKFQQSQS